MCVCVYKLKIGLSSLICFSFLVEILFDFDFGGREGGKKEGERECVSERTPICWLTPQMPRVKMGSKTTNQDSHTDGLDPIFILLITNNKSLRISNPHFSCEPHLFL